MGVRRGGKNGHGSWDQAEVSRKPEVSSLIVINWSNSCKCSLITGMTLTLHKNQVHCSGIMRWWAYSSQNLPLCLQKQIAKLVSALFYFLPLLRDNNMATNLQRLTSRCGGSVLSHVTVDCRHLGWCMQRMAGVRISHVLLYNVKRSIAANKAHFLQPVFPVRRATAQYHQTSVARKSHSCAFATFQNTGKTRKQREPIWVRCVLCSCFDKNLYLF